MYILFEFVPPVVSCLYQLWDGGLDRRACCDMVDGFRRLFMLPVGSVIAKAFVDWVSLMRRII